MTHQHPTPVPASADATPAESGVADTDHALAERCTSAGEYLAGLLAAAELDTVGRPAQLPEDLFPYLAPWDVRMVWDRALAVGYRAGQMSANPQWTPAALDRLRDALAKAGYGQMAAQTARSHHTTTPTRPHPADRDARTARGEHW